MKKLYKTTKLLFLVVVTFCISTNAFSQIKLDENKVSQFANEVFSTCNQYSKPEYFALYKAQIRRITIFKMNELTVEEKLIKNINTLTLKNKCNTSLQYENATNFNAENFNPLKYFFPKSETPLYYKIDGTEYIIQVEPLQMN